MKIIFLGPPGAGKGTQSEAICKEYGVTQLSTGNLLRDNIRQGTPLGKEASKYIGGGNLVPDEIIINIIREELRKPYLSKGYILDGYPRTVRQAEELDDILKEYDQTLDVALVLEVDVPDLVRRLAGRRTCRNCGRSFHIVFNPPIDPDDCEIGGCDIYQRPDDSEEAVKNRLRIYEEMTKPLIEYYEQKKLLRRIDGAGEMAEVYKRIKDVLDPIYYNSLNYHPI